MDKDFEKNLSALIAKSKELTKQSEELSAQTEALLAYLSLSLSLSLLLLPSFTRVTCMFYWRSVTIRYTSVAPSIFDRLTR